MAARLLTPPQAVNRGRLAGVPVLMYHGLADASGASDEERYTVSASDFAAQLEVIRVRSRTIVTLSHFWHESRLPQPSVVLTFDDGRASDYQRTWPLLATIGATADFFVNTARVGQRGYVTWSEIAEMQRGGMSFQSHSHEHLYLTRLRDAELRRQLGISRHMLEDRLGTPVDFVAAPYGNVDARVVNAALEVGYRAVCTSTSWPASPRRRTVPRVVVTGATSARQFTALVDGAPSAYLARTVRQTVIYFPKRVWLAVRARLGDLTPGPEGA